MKKILIVEDEQAIAKVLSAYLKQAGFEVITLIDGNQAMKIFEESKPSLVILDVMLPGRNGWEILENIRIKSSCPVIMLTALGQTKDKLKGFSTGADDYIAKPFAPEEVVARVTAILRRSSLLVEEGKAILFGGLKIDFSGSSVYVNGDIVELAPRDLSLLFYLAEHPNQTFTRDQLLDHVWGMDYEGSDRAVDLSIKRLRQVLREWRAEEGEIKTLRGVGYQLCVY